MAILAVACSLAVAAAGGARGEAAPAASWTPWVVPAPPAAPGGEPAERPAGRAVVRWMELALELASARAVTNPPATSRAYAYVSVAMCDAAIVAARRDPSLTDAAIAGAAAAVLADLFPERPPGFFAGLAREAAEAAEGRRAVEAGEEPGAAGAAAVEEGLRVGADVGAAVNRRARGDGFGRPWFGRLPRGAARWAPPPGARTRPVEPLAGRWRTWLLRSGSELRPGPPPRYGSLAFRREAREIVAFDARSTRARRRAARYWAGALPPTVWNKLLLRRLDGAGWSAPRQARALALLNVALADAGVAAWDTKYAYWSPRPENAIRSLRLGRRFDPDLDTPPFPAYVSGHAVYSAAAAEVMASLFGDADWRARAREAAESRLWGGIHYRSDSEVGLRMGREIGRRAVARAADAG